MLACIWDYYGSSALGTAEHFEKHLHEFITAKKVIIKQTGVVSKDTQAFVWCAGLKADLELIISILKPKYFIEEKDFKNFEIYLK
ncbi:hypothetical protein QEJ31_06365 [Pigmentibacter sp. JX0631]|uniref:hypothetical protein n=1 Tax=Pigmentibacter sp. JX0631 TaxID=2976982 RepID=UPI00246923C1|nr:hypothetical protein [Pigmentibacter sp. JX0631]WGL61214.1 hypothetical protein QEJ31_06365 [Pigmentibacter sp. JX0631]